MAITSPSPHLPERDRRGARRSRSAGPSAARPAPTLIGVGVDGSPSGRDAVAFGSLLACGTGVELMLIAVHEEPPMQGLLPQELGWSRLESQAREMLRETRDSLAPDARVVVESDALEWRGLRRVVRREHRDLLIVGSGHGSEEGRVRLGRTARDVVEHLECALGIAPSGLRDEAALGLERIGVGFDGLPESQAALALATSIAKTAGARLEVRGVVNNVVSGGLRTEQIALAGDAIVERELVSTFERDLAATRGRGVPTRLEVTAGNPSRVLSELCDHVDLLVIGSAHRAQPGRVLLGQTGRALVDGASCPLLVAPR